MRTITKSYNVYSFNELTPKAQAYALEKQSEYESNNWSSNFLIDDIKEAASNLGIEIDKFYYSGFYSQGDGASFTGKYARSPVTLASIAKDRPTDYALLNIAKALHDIQNGLESPLAKCSVTCRIHQQGHYYHANTMYIDDCYVENEDIGEEEYAGDFIEMKLLTALQNFAWWAYGVLQDAYEYQISDEACKENIIANEYEFLEDGRMAT